MLPDPVPPRPAPDDDAPLIPLFLRTRLWLFPRWVACCAWRSPRRAVAVLGVVVVLAGLAVLAARAPAGGCLWRAVAVPGERAHLVCVREGRPA